MTNAPTELRPNLEGRPREQAAQDYFNVYVDGSWLFRQCQRRGILAKHLECPGQNFRLDFTRLLRLLRTDLAVAFGGEVQPGDRRIYTSIIQVPDVLDPQLGDVGFIRAGSTARQQFIDGALRAGFNSEGVFEVPFRRWMVEKLIDGSYKEKEVDGALDSELVEQAIREPTRLHVVIGGDRDMLPAIRKVMPRYTDRVVLVTTHPEQYVPSDGQSSFRLNRFAFRHGPIYLEQHIESIVQGQYVYRCSNPECQKVFIRERPIPARGNPICGPCHYRRIAA